MGYVEAPLLAPTQDLLDAYREKKKTDVAWEDYERGFLQLMEEPRVEDRIDPAILAGGCLLCSEHEAARCHRRLVVEYLQRHWVNLNITHIV